MKNNNIISGILVLAVLLSIGLGCEKKSSFTYKGSEMEYKNVTDDEARQLMDYLIKRKFFYYQPTAIQVQLDKSSSAYQFRMIVSPEENKDLFFIIAYRELAKDMSATVFNDDPVDIHFCDENFETIRVLKF